MTRPDPDALLERERKAEASSQRGRLTVFFGAAPGVGKTWAMLSEARQAREGGRNVMVGLVETHGRADTEALLQGMPLLPRRQVSYRGIDLREFDLDAALAAHPGLLLVDELAHSNAPGSRHAKRWMDVEECLEAGIDVFTTLNVQHIESFKDLVARITGVTVRENVPDRVVAAATEVRVVDLPPDGLLRRLREGKVYVPDQASRAVERFFRKGNLIALREMALRFAAESVGADARAWRTGEGIEAAWSVTGPILVCVSPSPYSAPLIRNACRMARRLGVTWQAVHVENPNEGPLAEAVRDQLVDNLRLVQSLGGEIVRLTSPDPAKAIIEHARRQNLTQIIAGKPRLYRWRDRLLGSFVDRLVRESGDIDVIVTSADGEVNAIQRSPRRVRKERARLDPWSWLVPPLTVTIATLAAFAVFGRREPADAVMVYLLAILLVSLRNGLPISVTCAVLSVLAFDVFFIPPYLSVHVADMAHIVTFGVMLSVAVVISGLTERLKRQAERAQERERHTAALFSLSRDLGKAMDRDSVLRAGANHLAEEFHCTASVFVLDDTGEFQEVRAETDVDPETDVLRWVWSQGKEAGAGTDTHGEAQGFYLPLSRSGARVGVLGFTREDPSRWKDPEERLRLDAMVAQVALALDRALSDEDARQARLAGEKEALRSTLLSSVSHDLRTPLSSIVGAASGLLEGEPLEPGQRRELSLTIHEEARRLDRLVRNLLDMTRLESGQLQLNLEWQPLEEVLGAALGRMDDRLQGREVSVRVPASLPLVRIDAVLMEQVFVNLLENVLRHTPEGTPLEVTARARWGRIPGLPDSMRGGVEVDVADRGPGIPEGSLDRVFSRFQRVTDRVDGGVGLGLAICRAALTAHGGTIGALNRDGGGALLRMTLPLPEESEPGAGSGPPPEEATS